MHPASPRPTPAPAPESPSPSPPVAAEEHLSPFRELGLGPVADIAYSADGNTMALTRGNAIELWDDASGRWVRRALPGLTALAGNLELARTGSLLMIHRADGANLVDTESGQLVASVPGRLVHWAVLTSDGLTLAISYDVDPGTPRGVHLWARTGEHRAAISSETAELLPSPVGGDLIVVGGVGGPRFPDFKIVDTITGRVRWRRTRPSLEGLTTLAWSPDGRRVAWSFFGSRVHISEASSGTEVSRFDLANLGTIGAIAWHPRRDALAIASRTSLRYWDLETNRELWHSDVEDGDPSFSSDGAYLVVSAMPAHRPDTPQGLHRMTRFIEVASGRHCDAENFAWNQWRPGRHEVIGISRTSGSIVVAHVDELGLDREEGGGPCPGGLDEPSPGSGLSR